MEASIDPKIAKRRLAVERWKQNHREYYLEQRRILAHRPEYLAHRREMYKAKRLKKGPVTGCAFNTPKTFPVVEKQYDQHEFRAECSPGRKANA